ncbi:hypothetical protein [Dongia sp.]|uniref:hypothetical protein n=1 Tax=Dongia sp. TaxID=1977262 RepID=UPI003750F113
MSLGGSHLVHLTMRMYAVAAAVAIFTFAALGTITALWPNPFFIRMTPVSGAEIPVLGLQSLLFGLYIALPKSSCGIKSVGAGSLFTFLGVACPICNKLLVALFGTGLLLTYLEPARLYLGLAGLVVTGAALLLKSANVAVDAGLEKPAGDLS